MIDRGLSVAEVDGLLEVAGESVDIVKLGWGTAVVTANLRPKLERYAAHGIPVVLGGTLTEVAIRQGRVEGLVAWLRELGLRHVEISDGTIELDKTVKRELIERLSKEFTVFAEVGSKDVDFIMAPYIWVEQIESDLEAGAWKVIAEARESGTAGIYRADGEPRTGLIEEIAHAIDPRQADLRRPAPARSRSGCSSTSAPNATSATSPPPTCSRSRRCAWACAPTRSSASPRAARVERRLGGCAVLARRRGGARTVAESDPTCRSGVRGARRRVPARLLPDPAAKHRPTSVQQFKLTPNFAPTPAGRHKQEQISFKLAHAERGDGDDHRRATGTSWRRSLTGYPVAPLQNSLAALERAPGHRPLIPHASPRRAGTPTSCPRTGAAVAPAGEYRVRLRLSRQREPVLSPRSFTLERP